MKKFLVEVEVPEPDQFLTQTARRAYEALGHRMAVSKMEDTNGVGHGWRWWLEDGEAEAGADAAPAVVHLAGSSCPGATNFCLRASGCTCLNCLRDWGQMRSDEAGELAVQLAEEIASRRESRVDATRLLALVANAMASQRSLGRAERDREAALEDAADAMAAIKAALGVGDA